MENQHGGSSNPPSPIYFVHHIQLVGVVKVDEVGIEMEGYRIKIESISLYIDPFHGSI